MHSTENLALKIEQLVREHLAEVQRSTRAAVERGFASPVTPTTRMLKPSARRPPAQRREPEAVAALAERLLAAVVASPGETMGVLAEQLGVATRELNRPMNNLRRAGRLRSAGTRNQTRYFPAVGRAGNARTG